jgi:hypothetical protein
MIAVALIISLSIVVTIFLFISKAQKEDDERNDRLIRAGNQRFVIYTMLSDVDCYKKEVTTDYWGLNFIDFNRKWQPIYERVMKMKAFL